MSTPQDLTAPDEAGDGRTRRPGAMAGRRDTDRPRVRRPGHEDRRRRSALAWPIASSTADDDLRFPDHDSAQVRRLLESARVHLGMELALLTRIDDGVQTIEDIDGDPRTWGLTVGALFDHDDSYCRQVVGLGQPGFVRDAQHDPRTVDLEATHELGVGSYVGAPLRTVDGRRYGVLCCFSRSAAPALAQRDAQLLAVFADLLSEIVGERDAHRRRAAAITERVRAVLDSGGPELVFQPVHSLPDLDVVGYEALARFPPAGGGPEQWFADAAAVGLGVELELAASRSALAALDTLPAGVRLGINASPDAVIDDRLFALLADHDADRVLIEITEHVPVLDYPKLRAAADRLRAIGVLFSADDAGAGYAGLQHLVELQPEDIKLDISITRTIDQHPARAAIAIALVGFAHATHATLLAEGIETAEELHAVIDLGITRGQGFFLSRPGPLPR